MTFSEALDLIKLGNKLTRTGWHGKGMYVYLVVHKNNEYEPFLCLFVPPNTHQPGWLATQADMLSNDWEVVD